MKMITVEDGGYVFLKKGSSTFLFMDNKKYDNCPSLWNMEKMTKINDTMTLSKKKN